VLKIIWTEPAIIDLENIHAFIARDAEIYASAIVLEILHAVDRLAHFPKSGRKVPEQNDETIRELIVGNYRLIHKIEPNFIKIITIIHCARRFTDEGLK
jgi:toxin ParE1/3/4